MSGIISPKWPTDDVPFSSNLDLDSTSISSEYKYENLKICKTEENFLGMGSYGAVYKAKCDELPCAAKILHLVHLPLKMGDPGAQKIIKKFDMECQLLSHIRHPNIVQYLGTCRDPDTNLPVLLMELMDEGLTTFLENSIDPLQYHVQLNLCHDIALALAYLHRHGIIHRDLSSNNVLLIAGSRAKVTDFGMCKLIDVGTRSGRFSQTYCPGTEVYMAPEALRCSPDYTEKIDCFAFGVLVIQILTRQFPNPGPRAVQVSDPLSPTGTSERPVLEVDRRQSHVEQIPATHPLLGVATECLNYHPEDRPTARHLCSHLGDLKRAPQYIESHDIELQNKSISSPEVVLDGDETTRELNVLRQKVEILQHQLHAKEQQLLAKESEIARMAKVMMCHNGMTAPADVLVREEEKVCESDRDSNLHATLLQREKEIENLRSSLSRRDSHINDIQQKLKSMSMRELKYPRSASTSCLKRLSSERHNLRMDWKNGPKAPRKMALGSVAVDGHIIYARPSLSGNVYAYDSESQTWSELPPCSCFDFALVMAGGLLTAVGGSQSGGTTGALLSLIKGEHEEEQKWTKHFPSMKTGRSNSAVVSHGEHIVVAGGYTRPVVVSTVEVLDAEKKEWFSASSLPIPLSEASAAIYNDRLFIVGGWTLDKRPNRSVFSCLLSDLVSSAKNDVNHFGMWETVTQLPVYSATCTTVCGRLVVFGGLDSHNQASNDVTVYDSSTKSFESCGLSLIARYCCIAAPLPHSRVMLVGGYTNRGTTNTVEIASILVV